ncbi:DNA replication/repair protein RecF [Porphyromonas sp.]|uniref:DNA replication/repair protein RecF n=1 Tax=Porphyromonas sp. TaxID=1924944 RepID=UPI0026DD55F7|nr:DNA replication and repair protein RecF [Porphyromonas sp.]MDO4695296.1 DNA replication and repair protein RecF [Porphyromonas sp.]MDO4771041.1 DNA replication and repair protein RecF [Porphyromonas sp.]
MILKQLSLTNYKNIEATALSFSDKLNCIIGSNGMGKTNLLDSIYYLSFARTCVYLPDHMVIRNGSDMAILDGKYKVGDKDEHLYCGIRIGKAKVFRRNKKEYTKISDHIGAFPLVMISPADFDLIRGGSEERRKFMDMIISQESSTYLLALISYRKLLEQRNSMLKKRVFTAELMDIIEEQMASHSETIMSYRNQWLERIRPIFLEYYGYISDNSDDVSLVYHSSLEGNVCPTSSNFIETWKASRDKDLILGHTSIGPHRDDLDMLLNGILIRKIGSQGQNKTFMVALKFAQFRLLRILRPNNMPLLLLDDVFDKLDAHRVDRIVKLVSGEEFGQIFMSDTNRKYLDQILSRLPENTYSIFTAQNGIFNELKS